MTEDTEGAVLEAPDVEEVVETPEHSDPAPEDALADMRARLSASEQARVAAEQRAAQAGGQAANAQTAALEQAIQATEAKRIQAKANYRAAREAGDIDAEQEASEAAAKASIRLDALKAEQERLKNAPPRQAAPQQQQSVLPGAEAQRWLAEHPKVNTDRVYAAAVTQAHHQAVQSGIEVESPDYFRFCEAELRARFGPNHGKEESAVTETPSRQQQAAPAKPKPQAPASSYATPPGRGNATNARGANDINTIASKLGIDPDVLREFADVNNMPLDKYLKAQADIIAERGGSITYGEGAVLR